MSIEKFAGAIQLPSGSSEEVAELLGSCGIDVVEGKIVVRDTHALTSKFALIAHALDEHEVAREHQHLH